MGAATTKAEIREKIARKQGELARMKAHLAGLPKTSKDAIHVTRGQIASLQGEIARLKAKLANAPK